MALWRSSPQSPEEAQKTIWLFRWFSKVCWLLPGVDSLIGPGMALQERDEAKSSGWADLQEVHLVCVLSRSGWAKLGAVFIQWDRVTGSSPLAIIPFTEGVTKFSSEG